jgi:hypothetical protein
MPGIPSRPDPLGIPGRPDSLAISGRLDSLATFGRLGSLGVSDRLDSLDVSDRLGSLDIPDRLDSLGISGLDGWAGFATARDDGLFGSPSCLLPPTFTDGLCFLDGSICQSSRQRFVWPGYCTKMVEFKQLS